MDLKDEGEEFRKSVNRDKKHFKLAMSKIRLAFFEDHCNCHMEVVWREADVKYKNCQGNSTIVQQGMMRAGIQVVWIGINFKHPSLQRILG